MRCKRAPITPFAIQGQATCSPLFPGGFGCSIPPELRCQSLPKRAPWEPSIARLNLSFYRQASAPPVSAQRRSCRGNRSCRVSLITSRCGCIRMPSTLLATQNSVAYRFQIVPPDDPPDGAYQLRALVNSTQMVRSYAAATVSGQNTFRIRAQGVLGRFDHLSDASATDAILLHLDVIVTGSSGNDVPLENARSTISVTLANHTAGGDPAGVTFDQTIDFKSVAQLDSTDTYTVAIRAAYTTPDAVETNGETRSIENQRLLAFNGTVLFGDISTTLHQLTLVQTPGTPVANGISTGISVSAGGATVDGLPGVTYGSGFGFLSVVLRADGVAVASGSVTPNGSPGTGTLNGITFTRSSLTLNANGAHATLGVRLPTGLGFSSSKTDRTMSSAFTTNSTVTLDASFLPADDITWTPSGGGVRYACEESKPLWIEINGFTWHIAEGTIEMLATSSVQYVRTPELDQLDEGVIAGTYSNPDAALEALERWLFPLREFRQRRSGPGRSEWRGAFPAWPVLQRRKFPRALSVRCGCNHQWQWRSR